MRAPSPKHFVHGIIFLLANRLQVVEDQVIADITGKQWMALLAVAQWSGVPRVSDVAAELGSSRQNAAKLLEQLAQKGYVVLCEGEKDHRSRQVRLTDKAVMRMPQISAKGEQSLRQLFRGIADDDLAVAGRVLQTIWENAGEMRTRDPAADKKEDV